MGTTISGRWDVLVDPGSCENKRECLDVCPTGVFDMVAPRVRNPLIRLKIKVHGGVISAPTREEDCIGCMACVTACPESAITVTANPTPAAA